MIKLVCYNRFTELRKRFRVFDEKWWVLMGVIDPYECLEEGEVFVQYCKQVPKKKGKGENRKAIIMKGPVLVTRNPCVHPGDIRKVKAVDKPELKDYTNVIVFSSKGDRPEQDKMASGDLDGDIYWINWRKDFIENYQEKPPNGDDIQEEVLNETREIKKPIEEGKNKEYGWDSDSDDQFPDQETDDRMMVCGWSSNKTDKLETL